MTLGVWNRTRSLSLDTEAATFRDPRGFIQGKGNRPPFTRLIPLQETIAEVLGNSVNTKRVQREYHRIIQQLGSELQVLLFVDADTLAEVAGGDIAHGVLASRSGQVVVDPGYDGQYGKVSLPSAGQRAVAAPVSGPTCPSSFGSGTP